MTERTSTCNNYRFFESSKGQCRVDPPHVLVAVNSGGKGQPRGIWPHVREEDWCGRWGGKGK